MATRILPSSFLFLAAIYTTLWLGVQSSLPAEPAPPASASAPASNTAQLPPELEKALAMPEGKDRTNAVRKAALAWEQKDPAAAFDLVCAVPQNGPFDFLLGALGNDWGDRDPQAAIAWANAHMSSHFNRKAMVVFHLASAAWARKDPKAAAAWADKQPRAPRNTAPFSPDSARITAFLSVADGWAQVDPKAGAAWAETIPDPGDRKAALEGLVKYYVLKMPEDAAVWAAKLPPKDLTKVIAQQIAGGLARKDRAKAVEWVNSLPLSPADKDAVLTTQKLK